MQKRIAAITIASVLAMTPMSAMAATSDEIQQDIDATQEELTLAKSEAGETLHSQQALQEQIDDISAEITDLNDEMESLDNVTFREAISDVSLQILHSLKNIFNAGSENKKLTRKEQKEEYTEQLEQLQTELDDVSEELDENTQLEADMETKQTTLAKQLNDLQEEYDKALEEEEIEHLKAVRSEATEKAAQLEEEKEAARLAEEEEKAATEAATEEAAAQAQEDASSGEIPSVPAATSASYILPNSPGALTWYGGEYYFNGHRETWYTMRVWTGDLGIPGMYIGIDGIVRDCDNYICVASDDDPKGTVLETSLGTAKVYDSGPGHGIIDVYTDWPLY